MKSLARLAWCDMKRQTFDDVKMQAHSVPMYERGPLHMSAVRRVIIFALQSGAKFDTVGPVHPHAAHDDFAPRSSDPSR